MLFEILCFFSTITTSNFELGLDEPYFDNTCCLLVLLKVIAQELEEREKSALCGIIFYIWMFSLNVCYGMPPHFAYL